VRREKPDEQRCTANRPNGERCTRARWPGTDTCPEHDPDPNVRARYRIMRPSCRETTVEGAPCGRPARLGEDTCWIHNPETRCTARISGGRDHMERVGERCRNIAIPGGTVCLYHGGAAGNVQQAGAYRLFAQEVREHMRTYGEKLDIDAATALINEVQWTAGHVEWLRERVQELTEAHADALYDPDGTTRGNNGRHPLVWGVTRIKEGGDDRGTTEEAAANMWQKLYMEERQQLLRACTASLKAGVDERMVRIAESTGTRVAEVINAILGDLQLTPDQAERVRDIVPRRLRELTA